MNNDYETKIEARRTRTRRLRLAAAACLLAVGCTANTASSLAGAPAIDAPIAVTESTQGAAPFTQTSYADTVARVTPAVVTVNSERRVRASENSPLDDPRFREFFERFGQGGAVPQQPRRQSGVGSGIVVTRDGYILTNNHVVEDAERVRVTFTDNREFDAKVVGNDPLSDLAVLKIEADNLPVLPLGDSERVRVGDVVLAVGNPLGVGQTVTAGIVSAKNRASGIGDGSYADFIQTDAPINRGNSGGALVNTNGELIGINSQILSPSGGSIGIGFAIPTNMARNVMDQLIKGGKVRRSLLGVLPQPVTSDIARSLNLPEVRGVLVAEVTQGSAAERAGVRVGDVITKLNGEVVRDPNSFRNRIASTAPDSEITLTISRDGRDQDVRARLIERTDETASNGNRPGGGGSVGREPRPTPSGALGIDVAPLTPEQFRARSLNQNNAGGLLVRAIDPEGPAGDAGINEGDVILSANRQPVRTADDLRSAVERAGGRPLLLLISRRAQSAQDSEASSGSTQFTTESTRFVTVTPRTTTK